jgi:hypothetical protein
VPAVVVLGALGLALLSLLGPAEPTYDPWAWIVWSREVVEGSLSTTNGPSWKPLPVVLTTPFALLGDDVAPAAWLVIARAGGLLAIAMTYRLGARLAGRWAGVLAATALLLADEFVRNFARGNSEGLLVALVLAAIERHLDGARRTAFALGLAGALLRPELWPFLGLYGLFLFVKEPRSRVLVGAGFVALAVLWFGPEYFGSGNALRASDRARQPNPDSAAFADLPFFEVFHRAYGVLMAPVLIGAVVALFTGTGDDRRLRRSFALGALVLMVVVAAMTQAGYAGNLRYVALPAALLCALAGAGAVEVTRRSTVLGVLVALASAPFLLATLQVWGKDLRLTRDEAALYGELDSAIATAGGAARVRACGKVYTGRFDTIALAWRLHVPIRRVEIFPFDPGTLFATRQFSLTRPRPSALSRDPRYPWLGSTERWVVRQRCI